jgi:hypothetical protein
MIFSMLNWGTLNTLPNVHFKMTNNWTIIFQVLTAAVMPTMAFLGNLPALFQQCGRNILCLPSGWLHLVQVDMKCLGGRNACHIYIYIYIYIYTQWGGLEGIMINQSYGEGEERTVLVPSQWPLTVPWTPHFNANSERWAGGWPHVMNFSNMALALCY